MGPDIYVFLIKDIKKKNSLLNLRRTKKKKKKKTDLTSRQQIDPLGNR